ncbi:iron complex transport system ATP-binding protein [Roseibium hamelinense]|uniref:Iron complex transport system ATP-binding protein n=1 Tax=Roseibium hamelinense TaxID=150831 RepID=A0A562TAD5_9HYPH|nr:heme ABC transporter ATP-binding protein [Roseibium hamelinense]MTI45537.1 heme ABC transporter ATP-binding protein [Roseibium hamelinense]TWI90088.1 iron complex transport system ATP-binding protein [Roseibium hamelinense]
MTIAPFLTDRNATSRELLRVKDAGIRLGGTQIVDGVSFTVEARAFHTIIGPNGSGKSTLLKAVIGEHGYSGSICLAGHEIRRTRPEHLAFVRGVLAQQTSVAFPMTVSEVISLGFTSNAAGHKQEHRRQRIRQALCAVDLQGFEARLYPDLSGGEQQRVQLARVLCQVWEPVLPDGTPRWLFLDEPVSSLDIKHQIQIMTLAADYARRGGGILAVMHDLNLTARFADTVLVMRGGRAMAQGRVADVFEDDILSTAYDHPIRVNVTPKDTEMPFVLPFGDP